MQTLVELLLLRAQQQARQTYTFLQDGETVAAQISYAELDQRARAVAAKLQDISKPGDRVLLLYPPGLDFIIAFFGCLYAGCIAVPAYPPQIKRLERSLPRLLAIAEQAKPAAALTVEEIAAQASSLSASLPVFQGLHWVPTDTLPVELADAWRPVGQAGDAIAFLQYTSGSTATPKGVMVSHANLLHNLGMIQRAFRHTSESVLVGWLPLYHDMGLIGVVLEALFVGGNCVLMPPAAFLQSPIRWLRAISTYRGTTSGAPNFAYDLCTRRITPEQRETLDLSSWRVAFNGAEPLRAETLERFTQTFAPQGFRPTAWHPCYGLAEATLIVSGAPTDTRLPLVLPVDAALLEQHSLRPVDAEQPGGAALVSSGLPDPEQQIAIVDPHSLRRCAPDQVGEIWVASPSNAHGYWDMPEASAETFQARLADSGEGPFLRTGDLGFLRDNALFVTGRLKDLIIIRGRNHYPQDIELTVERSHAALRPGCGAAFSVEQDGGERLVIVQELEREHRNTDTEAVIRAIRSAVAEQHELQAYAVVLIRPNTVFKTSSGKIQRRACRGAFLQGTLDVVGSSILEGLPATEEAADEQAESQPAAERPAAPLSRLARAIRAQIAGVLGLAPEQIDPDQPLSSLALDSMMAVEVQHRLEQALGQAPSISGLLEGGSIAELAAELEGQTQQASPAVPVLAGPAAGVLSYGQQALWLVHRMAPHSAAYNTAGALQLHGPVDPAILRQSFQILHERHPALRTTFAEQGGLPVRQIQTRAPVSFHEVDATGWSGPLLEQRLVEEARRPFNLERGPILRVSLYARAADEHVLLIVLHHIAADFWSLAVLMEELDEIYRALRDGAELALPPATPYDAFVAWQHALLAGPRGERLWAYWRERLAGELPVLRLPTDRPRPAVQRFSGALHTRSLPADLTRALRDLSRSCRATLFTTLLATFEVLLHRYSGQTDLLIGSPMAGRSHADLASVIGYCANPVVLRGDLSGDPSFRDLIEDTRRTVLDALEHQDFPFPLLVERLQPVRDPSRPALFQAMFIMQKSHVLKRQELAAFALGAPHVAMELGGIRCESLALDEQIAQFDLTLRAAEVGQQLVTTLEYNTDLFDPGTTAQMLDAFVALLQQIVAGPDRRLAELVAAISPRPLTLAVAATFTAEPLEEPLRFWMEQLRTNYALRFAPYNQIFQELIDPGSLLSSNQDGANILMLRLEDWGGGPDAPPDGALIEQHTRTFLDALAAAVPRTPVPWLICFCPPSPLVSRTPGLLAAVERMEHLIAERAARIGAGRVRLMYAADSAQRYRVGALHDQTASAAGHIPYTPELFAAAGTALARTVFALHHPPAKVIVVDCDMTLWQGRCGDDTPQQLVLDPGSAALQQFLVAQANAGVLLCLCSKNNEADVLEVFAQRPDFPLQLGHLVAWRINWLPKSENLRSLASDLRLGLDSFVFLDDDQVECAEVRARCPEVLTLRLPSDPALVPTFLEHIWAFDRAGETREDAQRTAQYQQNRLREQAQASFLNLETFLESLNLQIRVTPLEPDQLERAAQLTQRTNQFNSTTVRRTVGELQQLADGGAIVKTVRVADRFGDYGLVGLAVARAGADLEVETLLLSCRALGKRVEDTLLLRLAQIAQERGCARVVVRYRPTAKNPPVRAFLRRVGLELEPLPDGSFQAAAPVDALLEHPRLVRTSYGHSFGEPPAAEQAEAGAPEQTGAAAVWTPARFPGAARVLQQVAPELTSAAAVQAAVAASQRRARPALQVAYVAPHDRIEQTIATAWRGVLHVDRLGVNDNFFDLGGHSILLVRVHSQLCQELGRDIPLIDMFRYPTIAALAAYLSQGESAPAPDAQVQRRAPAAPGGRPAGGQEIAVIGLAGRFPRANDLEAFWRNLREGAECVTFFSDEELAALGVEAALLADPHYVKAGAVLDAPDRFDAAFFGYSPREAELIDPQQRLFLECAWQALEQAAYQQDSYAGQIGVYAGSGLNHYLMQNLAQRTDLVQAAGDVQTFISNDKDFTATRVSYKLNLRGPSLTVQTACSTSLVAVHMACQGLLSGDCDIALAGGVSLTSLQPAGYLYRPGEIVSPDGHCRAFDAEAQGSLFGSGAGVVALKRLEDALADGDTVHAVIKGSAINNDGAQKLGFTAPSVEGQARVIRAAQRAAGVDPASISYVETHGTGTPLGDPIEIAALSEVFRGAERCLIGSVKTNIGHLDVAAGVAGLIKTVLALQHRQIPPSLHFRTPNPKLQLERSPFVVNTELTDWPTASGPRRAGVSAFGLGGTNAHVVLEESPPRPQSQPGRPWQLLVLSARTPTALDAMAANLAGYLQAHPEVPLADVAYTLQVGRRVFEHRRALVASSHEQAAALLRGDASGAAWQTVESATNTSVSLAFSGLGDHYVGMGQELYTSEPVFRTAFERCAAILRSRCQLDLLPVLYPADFSPAAPSAGPADPFRRLLEHLAWHGDGPLDPLPQAHATMFAVGYALTVLLQHWGLQPAALIGYSLGEYLSACFAGVLTLEDALTLVVARARLLEQAPPGAMLGVALSAAEVAPALAAPLALAADNGPRMCVVAGPPEAVAAFQADLTARGVACRPVNVAHAFHTPELAPLADAFRELVARVPLRRPSRPYLSTVTGGWVTDEVTDPAYWVRHMVAPVQWHAATTLLLEETGGAVVEIGPGQGLGSMLKQHPACGPARRGLVLSTLPAVNGGGSDAALLLGALGKLWLAGVPIAWSALTEGERRLRVPLPTYPFERQRFWVDLPSQTGARAAASPAAPQAERARTPAGAAAPDLTSLERLPRNEPHEWFYLPAWKQTPLPPAAEPAAPQTWLIFADSFGLGEQLARSLQERGQTVALAQPGELYGRQGPLSYRLNPRAREDYTRLIGQLHSDGRLPQQIVHMWCVSPADRADQPESTREILDQSFFSLLGLAQALGEYGVGACQISVVSSGLQSVTGEEPVEPAKATVLGPCNVIPLEYPGIRCRSIDISLPSGGNGSAARALRALIGELSSAAAEPLVALRGASRWVRSIEPVTLAPPAPKPALLRERGVYLITGGLGGVGQALAEYLVQTVRARLVLVGRTALPPRAEWDSLLALHGPDSEPGRRIGVVRRLEQQGGEVLTVAADVASRPETEGAVAQALARFGQLNGVIHAAGVPGVGLIPLKTTEAAEQVLSPKVYGTLALGQALQGLPLDFLVLCSSVTSSTGGGPGQIDYSAANAFLDAYALRHADHFGRTIAIDWGEWQWNTWETGLTGYDQRVQQFFRHNRERFGISFAEGAQAFQRALEQPLPRVVVSTQDFRAVAELGTAFSVTNIRQQIEQLRGERDQHVRPALGVSYLAPETDFEQTITAVWERVLGIDGIGVDDNFFDLGGNSLIGIELISRLRAALKIDAIPSHILYEAPSIRTMALSLSPGQTQTTRFEQRQDRGNKRRERQMQRKQSL